LIISAQYQVKIDSAVCCIRSNVHLNWTDLPAVPSTMSISNPDIILQFLCWFFLSFCYLVAAFEL